MEPDRHAWQRPGAFEVGPGVHRIPLPLPNDGLRAVNVYAIADGDGLVLIDGGWAMADATDILERGLGEIGFTLRDIREFLVTHVHRDHYTQAVAVRRITGSEISLGEGERASLQAIQELDLPVDADRLRRAGAHRLAEIVAGWRADRDSFDVQIWEEPDHWLGDGIDLGLATRTLRVIATPGHTVGHVVFHDAEANALFAGDHVLPHITPSIGVEPVHRESPLRDFMTSLALMRKLPDATLLPAHGPIAPSTHARVDELLDHHERRLTATAEAVAGGASTAFEVAGQLGWTRREHKLADLDFFNAILAINETMSHLIVLVERGWLTTSDVDGVAHFARA